MLGMKSKLVAFRCPQRLMARVDALAHAQGKTRSRVITEAVRLLATVVQERGGRLVPPYLDEELPEGVSLDPLPPDKEAEDNNSNPQTQL